MAVASKSTRADRRNQIPSKARAVVASDSKIRSIAAKAPGSVNRSKSNGKTVTLVPGSQIAPLWLLSLCTWQRRLSVVSFLLIVMTLGVYAATVFHQQTWSHEYRKLARLQRDERQLTTNNELLKTQLALQAEQLSTRLLPLAPARAIFLKSTPVRPTTAVSTTKSTEQMQAQTPSPLGY